MTGLERCAELLKAWSSERLALRNMRDYTTEESIAATRRVQDCKREAQNACVAYVRAELARRVEGREAVATESYWSLPEALALVECFGGSNCAMSVREFAAGEVASEDGVLSSPAGKYAWCSEYPEEGVMFLAPHDTDTEECNAGGFGLSQAWVTEATKPGAPDVSANGADQSPTPSDPCGLAEGFVAVPKVFMDALAMTAGHMVNGNRLSEDAKGILASRPPTHYAAATPPADKGETP